jgi:hypothetical protein
MRKSRLQQFFDEWGPLWGRLIYDSILRVRQAGRGGDPAKIADARARHQLLMTAARAFCR